MKRRALTLLLIPIVASVLHAEDKDRLEANVILRKASELETFKVEEVPKYRLEVHFSFLRPNREDVKGILTSESETPFLWHEEVEFGNYKYQRVRIRKQIWVSENDDFMPLPLEEFLGALRMTSMQLTPNNVVKRVRDRKIGGAERRCIELDTIRGKDREGDEVCVEKDTGYFVYWRRGAKEISYSDFSPIGAIIRPRRIEVEFEGKEKMIADVNYHLVDKFDPTGFEPIVGGEVKDICFTSTNPVAKQAAEPVYPLTVKRGSYRGKILVDVKVGPDGTVQNEAVVESLQPELDASALDAAKKWTFEPGTCNGKPVKSVSRIEVTYH